MKIVTFVKYVPDSSGVRSFAPDNTTDRSGADGLLCELDEHAVEQSLRVVEAAGEGEITYVTVGPEQAGAALRKALSMGGDAAVHVVDDAIHGSDAVATSLVLSKVLDKLEYDLVITGMASTDAGMSVVPAMVAERVGLPAVTLASELTVADGKVRIRRDSDDASVTIEASLPAIASVTDQIGEARYPSFKGIMAAKKKPVTTYSLADLGISADEVGLSASWSQVDEVTKRPPRSAGVKVVDEGDGGVKLAEFLVSQKFI
jgi:electron transfer flavoprotein beta subunit